MKVDSLHNLALMTAAFFWSLSFFAQHQVKIEKQFGEMDYAPRIKGVYDGDISTDKLCSSEGITTRIGAKIITFDLLLCTDYENTIHVIGNEIPDSLCVTILDHCVYSDLFITNIKSMDIDGSIKNLNPLRFFILPEE